jgi:hypothetical protein
MPTAPDNHDAHEHAEPIRKCLAAYHPTQNPILRFGPASFPACSTLAFFAFAISRCSIACITLHFAVSISVLPA